MTREEALIRVENLMDSARNIKDQMALQMAWDALREQEAKCVEIEAVKPLTLDELREMDGEPIYLKSLGEDFEDGWQIIAAVYKNRISCRQLYVSTLFFEQYGKTWIAYRYRPKEETNNG